MSGPGSPSWAFRLALTVLTVFWHPRCRGPRTSLPEPSLEHRMPPAVPASGLPRRTSGIAAGGCLRAGPRNCLGPARVFADDRRGVVPGGVRAAKRRGHPLRLRSFFRVGEADGHRPDFAPACSLRRASAAPRRAGHHTRRPRAIVGSAGLLGDFRRRGSRNHHRVGCGVQVESVVGDPGNAIGVACLYVSCPAPGDRTSPAVAPNATAGPPSEAHAGAPAAGSTPRLHVDAGVDALGSFGMVPSASPGVSAFARGRVKSWSLSIEFRADLPESATRSAALGGGRVESWLAAAGFAPCFHVGYAAACAVAMLGSLQASGQDIDPRSSRATPFVAAGVRLGIEWPESTMVALRVHVDGLANLHRARLMLGQTDEVWPAPPFAGTAGAGVVLRFP